MHPARGAPTRWRPPTRSGFYEQVTAGAGRKHDIPFFGRRRPAAIGVGEEEGLDRGHGASCWRSHGSAVRRAWYFQSVHDPRRAPHHAPQGLTRTVVGDVPPVSYTHLRAHETDSYLV